MANLYNTTASNNYSSSSFPHQEPDEISLFLQQILLRSSSASSSSFVPSDHLVAPVKQEPEMGRIFIPDPSTGLNSFSGCSLTTANVLSSSAGNLDNEPDECDYESEEAVEALVEEMAPKPTPPRGYSKRTRAAEVHNLSEKRRRSRINEKMKALQNLIPNSNKTDKASMLDEAIEYLKQLQLQVQMLTLRNGLSVYPIGLPGMLQPNQISQTRMDVYDADKLVNMKMTQAICMDHNISADALLSLQENCVKQAPVTDFSSMIGSKHSLEVESSMQQHHFGAFQLSRSSREKVLPCQPLIENRYQSSSGAKATSSIPSETQTSDLKDNVSEACQAGGDHLLLSFVNSPIFSSQLNT